MHVRESFLITALEISSIRHRETAIFTREHVREGTSRLFICKSSECMNSWARDDEEREPESLKAMKTMFSVSPMPV